MSPADEVSDAGTGGHAPETGTGTDAATEEPGGSGSGALDVDRARQIIARVVERISGNEGVRSLLKVFEAYDGVGGGLTAAGLAYAALFAVVPGLLLVLSVVGLLVKDAAVTEQMVSAISAAVPPLEPVVRAAFEQVSAGAVPTGIVAVIGLLWGSSRFYASLDYAFTKIFQAERRRNELERGARGILVSAVFVALPILLIIAGSVIALVLDIAPGGETWSVLNAVMVLGNPLATVALFIGGTALIYRFVPTANVSRQAYGRPAILTGLVLAVFTQLFAFIAPRMLGWAALFGALVAVFALLVWMSISLNMLLLGACWTRVRLAVEEASVAPAAAHGTEPQGR